MLFNSKWSKNFFSTICVLLLSVAGKYALVAKSLNEFPFPNLWQIFFETAVKMPSNITYDRLLAAVCLSAFRMANFYERRKHNFYNRADAGKILI